MNTRFRNRYETNLEKIVRLDKLYKMLPTIECKKLCQGSCGPIGMNAFEYNRVAKKIGREPRCGTDLVCPMLDREAGVCTVYEIRPVICRLFGLVEKMKCPHGCTPSRYLSNMEVEFIFKQIHAITGTTENRVTLEMEQLKEILEAASRRTWLQKIFDLVRQAIKKITK